ncbi:MAG: hypothetical protein M1830_008492 [Pleopsidium flavum]|nr:MAG: hypothetical protein M1830_008492 [Pleopsidium flavum]
MSPGQNNSFSTLIACSVKESIIPSIEQPADLKGRETYAFLGFIELTAASLEQSQYEDRFVYILGQGENGREMGGSGEPEQIRLFEAKKKNTNNSAGQQNWNRLEGSNYQEHIAQIRKW